MKRTALLAILLCVSALAYSGEGLKVPESDLRLEVAFGQCRFQKSPDGMWWQKDQENNSRYKDNGCGEFGIRGTLNPVFGWSLRYVNLGRAHTNSRAVTCPADNCANRDPKKDFQRADCMPKFNEDNCRYQWLGDGGIKGIAFALNAELFAYGRFSLEGEAGAMLYQLKWNAQIYPLGCHDGACPWRETVDQKTNYALTPLAGLALRYRLTEHSSIFLKSDIYFRTQQHLPISAGIGGYAQTWLAGMSMSF